MTTAAQQRTGQLTLSVILVTDGDGAHLRRSLKCLHRQTLAERLEILIVGPTPSAVEITEADEQCFASVRAIACDPQRSLAAARAAGVRAARGRFVAIAEDHCWTSTNWAESLTKRLLEGYASVGPEMINGNPHSTISWCSFLGAYGRWAAPVDGGVVDTVAGHNWAAERSVLMEHESELDLLMSAETVLHWEMGESGHEAYTEPDARCVHVNVSRIGSYLKLEYHVSRIFAAVWSRHWTWGRRVHMAAISPLIAVKQWWLVVRRAKQSTEGMVAVPRFATLLAAGKLIGGLGYALGFLAGAGGSLMLDWEEELHRDRHLSAADRERYRSA